MLRTTLLLTLTTLLCACGSAPKAKYEKSAPAQELLTPQIRADEAIRGTKGGDILIVEFSDFQCPYCSRGYFTVKKLLQKYKGNIQVIYKHLPLPNHPQALLASRYFEALRIQSEKMAFAFHDTIYENQHALTSKGQSFIEQTAKKLGADMNKLKKDASSTKVYERINEDVLEAQKLGFRATPSFVVNGSPLVGAQPLERFEQLIESSKKR